MKSESGWAIVGVHGLYTGWHPIRREMIALHVAGLYDTLNFTLSGKLSLTQAEMWKKCQRKGDRAVRVRLTYKPS